MLFEPRLGKLIRKLNPYTNGGMDTMLCGVDPPGPALLKLATDLSNLATALTNYANGTGTIQGVNQAEAALDPDMPISDLPIRIDNDFKRDYMTWVFRGEPYAVKRALRLSYRYELTDRQGNGMGVMATEHVLIGYAGGNG